MYRSRTSSRLRFKSALRKSRSPRADEGTPFYSLEGAQFSVFQHCENGVCSGLITEFSTNAQGYAEIELAPGQGVWIREDRAPWDFAPGMHRGIWK